ncbi:ATP-dependent RNA helicase DbpA [Pseudomonadales bacterium]|nr:ATP-dependent RNA helicase DbpA [Pseudomonadales bacterium]
MSSSDFSSLALAPELITNLSSLGYHEMTPIQAQSLPKIIVGEDVIAQGKTGSGKTAAFGLGLLASLNVKQFRIQALVLCPTRELADQVAKEIRRLARSIHNIKVLTLCGGMPFGPQIGSLEHGAHIIVGTPGRIEEHVRKGTLVFHSLKTLVLDEADRMLEMGFQPALDKIIEGMPANRQTLLFSATFPDEIESVARQIMRKPVRIEVESLHANHIIEQRVYEVGDDEHRLQALQLLLLDLDPESAVVFCNTKRETQALADGLKENGFSAMSLHGDLDQKQRDQALVRFDNKSINIIVATDVAARGLDIEALDTVVNYHIARDLDVHVHRIGRTGRAGSQGVACTLVSDKEKYKLNLLEAHIGQTIAVSPLPSNKLLNQAPRRPAMATLQIDGGKKQKVRAGDIVGALTAKGEIDAAQVGKIQIFDHSAYIAVTREVTQLALDKIAHGKLKGRSFRVRHIRG